MSNPIYVGRIAHKGQVHEGQHPPIVDQDFWDRVQQSLREHLAASGTKKARQSSEALLAGKLFDDRGNRMSPTWARKGTKCWRYYVSQAALQGDKSKAGSIVRVPAAEVEAVITEAVGKLSADGPASQADTEPDRSRNGRPHGDPGPIVRGCGGGSGRKNADVCVDAALALSQA